MSEPEPELVARLRSAYEAFNREDFDTVTEFASPDIEFFRIGSESPLKEEAALRAWFEPDAFEEQRFEPTECIVNGNRVLVHLRASARGAGSGIEMEVNSWNVCTFDDERRVARMQALFDHEEGKARAAAGLDDEAG